MAKYHSCMTEMKSVDPCGAALPHALFTVGCAIRLSLRPFFLQAATSVTWLGGESASAAMPLAGCGFEWESPAVPEVEG